MITMLVQFRRLLPAVAVPMLWLGLSLTVGCNKKPTMETFEKTPYLAIPPEANSLVSIDFSRLRNRDKIQQLLKETEQQQPRYGAVMNALRTRVGFDPLQRIDMLYLAELGKQDPINPMKNTLIIARGDFKDPKPTLDKLQEWLGEEFLITPPPFAPSQYEDTGIMRYKTRAQSQYDEKLILDLNFAFPTERLMLFSMDANSLDHALGVVSQTVVDMRKDLFWQDMLKRPAIGSMIWGAGHLPPGAGGQLQMQGALASAKDYFFDMNFNEAFDFHVGLVCDTIEKATELTKQIKDQTIAVKPMVAMLGSAAPETVGLIDKLYFITEKEVTKISLKLSAEETRKLWEEWDRLAQQGGPGALPAPEDALMPDPNSMPPAEPAPPAAEPTPAV